MTTPLEEAANLSSIRKYLNVLKDNHLVTPSIGKPYPDVTTEESMIMHRALLSVQNVRIRELDEKISNILASHNLALTDVWNNPIFIEKWTRLKKKIGFLKRKFRSRRNAAAVVPQSSRNKKSRERYKMRKFKKLLRTIGTDSVLNLSSVVLSPAQSAVLSLGSGFIPSSTNRDKEEEILLLEGLRVIDRIGNLDMILKNENENEHRSNNTTNEIQTPKMNFVEESTVVTSKEFYETDQKFSRCQGIPSSLRIHQPQERTLSQPITKLIKKKFDEQNSKLLNKVRSKNRRGIDDNLPKKLRLALKELQKMVREKKVDIRKVDKGDMIHCH